MSVAAAAGAPLSDPHSCGEDLDYNLLRATQIGPTLCGPCADYHVLFPARRLTGRVNGLETDRPDLIATVGREVAARAAAGRPAIDILIAGSADTGVLATCAHAAFAAAPDAIASVRFTVLDLCGTPLELCRDFAARHRLTFARE